MKMILILEDNEYERELYEDILNAAGYETEATGDYEEALEIVADEAPALILSDIHLSNNPLNTGYSFLETIKRPPYNFDRPVVIISGVDKMANIGTSLAVRMGMSFGASDYIVKPTDAETLLETVDKFLKQPTDQT